MRFPISFDDIKEVEPDIIQYRRSIHMHPETGFEEFKTSAMVADLLQEFGVETIKGIGKTGVIGVLKGPASNKIIALRADMDALNIQEQAATPYKSKISGKMHACGHDAHTAMLLGAAKVLSKHRKRLKGTVKFIFQPAEEGPVPSGGNLMMASGQLDDADAVFGIHVNPMFETGQIAIARREAMASTDFFKVDLIGKGGHAAMPHKNIDPIMMAGQTLCALQNIISAETDPVDPAVLSVCTINGGSQFNAIPEKVTMTGTVRTLCEETREKVFRRMEAIAKHVSGMHHGTYEIERVKGYPVLVNDDQMVQFVMSVSKTILGDDNVLLLDKPALGGEDFAYYLKKIPGAFFWLGCGNKQKGLTAMLHNARFEPDEDALVLGTAMHVNLACHFLNL
jgi:amidohydrolase